MNEPAKICPKCQGEMFPGFIPDFGDQGARQSSFYAGDPRRAWFGGVKINENDAMPVGAYCCVACGFLEFYASEKFRAW